jgi:hypothetical protein
MRAKSPCPRGDDIKSVKMHGIFLKIFSRTSWPISIKLGAIQNCSNKGPGLQWLFLSSVTKIQM